MIQKLREKRTLDRVQIFRIYFLLLYLIVSSSYCATYTDHICKLRLQQMTKELNEISTSDQVYVFLFAEYISYLFLKFIQHHILQSCLRILIAGSVKNAE